MIKRSLLGKYPNLLINLLLILCGTLSVSAETFTYNYEDHTFYFESIDENTCKLVRPTEVSDFSGDIKIPSCAISSVASYDVIMIDTHAFYNCTSLTSVTIPNTVTSIGYSAFQYCTGLTSIIIPNSVTSIRANAFSGCPNIISVKYCTENPIGYSNGFDIFESDIYYRATLYLLPAAIERARDLYPWNMFQNVEPIDDSDVTRDFEYTYEGQTVCYHVIDQDAKTCTAVLWKNVEDTTSDGILILPENPRNGDIEYTLTEIRNWAFFKSNHLVSVDIPHSVTSIGYGAFAYCYSLTSVNIPNTVTTIGWSAFEGCRALTSVIIPNSVSTIGLAVFSGCIGLTEINIPNSVTSIERYAFYGCNGLQLLSFPSTLEEIQSEAFSGCSNLLSIKYYAENPIETNSDIFEAEIYSRATLYLRPSAIDIVQYIEPWKRFENLGIIDETYDFEFTYEGQTVSYRVIDQYPKTCAAIAWRNSDSVPSSGVLILPENPRNGDIEYTLTEIADYAFYECSGLTSVTIPNSVTSIGVSAFLGCVDLNSVNIPNSVTTINEGAFSECSSLTTIELPNSITIIGAAAFWGCYSLTSVTIPNLITTIGVQTFAHCTSLASVTIPNSVTSIGVSAFEECTSLSEVTIPNTVTTIEYAAFMFCTGLNYITLPNSVTEIDEAAFSVCTNLVSIQYLAENPIEPNPHIFHSLAYDRATLYLLPTAIDRAREIEPWKNFKNIEPIDLSGKTQDFAYTCEGETIFYHIIDDATKTCRAVLWKNSESITSERNIILPANPKKGDVEYTLIEIGESALENCLSVISVTIPETVITIREEAFLGCTGLASVDIPNSVTTIGIGAFENCISLTSVDIPDSVTTIGADAFASCTALTSVKYYTENPIKAPSDVFDSDVYANATLYLPQVAIEDASKIVPWCLFENVEAFDSETAVEDVYVDEEPAEIYTPTGIKIGNTTENLTSGIYIERRGNTARKIRVM